MNYEAVADDRVIFGTSRACHVSTVVVSCSRLSFRRLFSQTFRLREQARFVLAAAAAVLTFTKKIDFVVVTVLM